MPRQRKPEGQKVTRHKVAVPEVEAEPGGWRFGDHPIPPDGLLDDSLSAWSDWFGSWWSAMWTPADVGGLRVAIRAFDDCLRGNVKTTALLPLLEQYGITPKGRKMLAWLPPKDDAARADRPAGRPQLKVVDAS